LLALLEGLGLVVEALYLAQLLLVAGLQGADLPDPPPAGGNARSTQQQGDDCQAIATARRGGPVSGPAHRARAELHL